jgi:hypothetical protein
MLSPSKFLLFPPTRIEQLFRAIIKAEKPTYQVETILTTPSSYYQLCYKRIRDWKGRRTNSFLGQEP